MDRKRLAYMPGLDGLRGLAVAAVVLYHAETHWLPGGFLGVDVFFVISGYLITSLLLSERAERGSIDLRMFWFRRGRRLLPALFFLLVATLAFALVFTPGDVARLRFDSLAAAGYVSNWYLIFRHQPYFETLGRPSLFQHLWSLAVEEQFYLVWPPIFAVLTRVTRLRWTFAFILAGILASTLMMVSTYVPGGESARSYYGTDTRAAELLVGAALAFVWTPGSTPRWATGPGGPLLDVLGVGALAFATLATLRVQGDALFIYRGGLTLFALLTAVVIAATVRPGSLLSRFGAAWPPLRWVGLRSYSIYLWHWPVFMMTRPQVDVPLDGLPLLALRVAITVVVAEVSYRFVEAPVRAGALSRVWRMLRQRPVGPRLVLGRAAAYGGSLFVVSVGVLVACAQPARPPSYLALTPVNTVRAATPDPPAPSFGETAWLLTNPPFAPQIAAAERTLVSQVAAAEHPPPPAGHPVSVSDDVPPQTSIGTSVDASQRWPSTTAIGDSVMLGAVPELQRRMPDIQIDAAVGRQVSTVIGIVQKLAASNELGQVVVLHIGNNGTFSSSQFDTLMSLIGPQHTVVFIDVKADRDWASENNRVIEQGVARYPNASLLDWLRLSQSHPEYFYDDGIHLRPAGQVAYAQLIAWSVALAIQ